MCVSVSMQSHREGRRMNKSASASLGTVSDAAMCADEKTNADVEWSRMQK